MLQKHFQESLPSPSVSLIIEAPADASKVGEERAVTSQSLMPVFDHDAYGSIDMYYD